MMDLRIIKFGLVLVLGLGVKGAGFAQGETGVSLKNPASGVQASLPEASAKADEPKEETLEKTMDGVIAGVSSNFIAIDYGQDEKTAYEMTFNITKDTRLERIKNIKNLKSGDTVWVSYNEKIIKKDKKVRVIERVLKVLRFLNPAKPVVEAPVPAEKMVTEAVE
jgi:hypothetical protein